MALKIILKNDYKNYQNALNILEIQTLKERREELCLSFARKCLNNTKMKHLFPPNKKTHELPQRNSNNFEVFHANTERKKNSPIIYMQKLLNSKVKEKIQQYKMWNLT